MRCFFVPFWEGNLCRAAAGGSQRGHSKPLQKHRGRRVVFTTMEEGVNTGTAGSSPCFPPCVHHSLEKHVLELSMYHTSGI